jgi:hypothetical protein
MQAYLSTNYPHETKKVFYEAHQAKIAEENKLAKYRAFYDWLPLIVTIIIFTLFFAAKVLTLS